MPTPIALPISLTQNARADLQALARANSTRKSLALRAYIVLRATQLDRPTNPKIGHELDYSNLNVGEWRRRYLELGLAGLQDARRSGQPRAISSTQVQLISVASILLQNRDRSVTRWTLDEITATLLDGLGTEPISRSSIWRILKDATGHPCNG